MTALQRTNFDLQRELDIRDARDRVVEAAERLIVASDEWADCGCEGMSECPCYREYERADNALGKAVRALRAARGEP